MTLPCLALGDDTYRIYRAPTEKDTDCSHLQLVINDQGVATGTSPATGTINFVPVRGAVFILYPSTVSHDPNIAHDKIREFIFKGYTTDRKAVFKETMFVTPAEDSSG